VTGNRSKLSEGWHGYRVDTSKSDNYGWIVGNMVISRTGSGSALLARMLFDKDNPADRI
jgi:hypothetical protein